MKRSPITIALVVLGYLAAGAVVNLLVAAGCALWSPLSEPFERHYSYIPKHAEHLVPEEWLCLQRDPLGQPTSVYYEIEAKELCGVGVSFTEVQAQKELRGKPSYPSPHRVRVLRVGLPTRFAECSTPVQKTPLWPERAIYATDYSPALPLAHCWGGSPRYPDRWDSSLAIEFALAGRYLPLGVRALPFTLSSGVWAAGIYGLMRGMHHLLAIRRIRRNQCTCCAYPIGVSDCCTECGRELPGWVLKLRGDGSSRAAMSEHKPEG